jgi:uncharacterized membrane protein
MFARNEHLSPLQRRSGLLLAGTLLLTMLLFFIAHDLPAHFTLATTLLHLLQILPAIPVAAMVWIVGQYLVRETDEFIRMIVTRSLLWGLGVTMVANIVLNVLFAGGSAYGPSQIFDIDIFFATSFFVLLIEIGRNQ